MSRRIDQSAPTTTETEAADRHRNVPVAERRAGERSNFYKHSIVETGVTFDYNGIGI